MSGSSAKAPPVAFPIGDVEQIPLESRKGLFRAFFADFVHKIDDVVIIV
jgi:hypothetical protein